MKIITWLLSFSGAGIVFFKCSSMTNETAHDIFLLTASLSGTLLGFVLVAASILMTISNRDLIKKLVISGHHSELKNGLFWSACTMFVNMILAFFFLFVGAEYLLELITVLSFTFVYSLCVLLSASYKLYLVVEYIDN